MIYVPGLSLTYYPVPKCGCTTMRAALIDWARRERGFSHPKQELPHQVLSSVASYVLDRDSKKFPPDELVSKPGVSLAIVRDPAERMLSAYRDKVCREDEYLNVTKRRSPGLAKRVKPGDSFEKVASAALWLLENEPSTIDTHWQPQTFEIPVEVEVKFVPLFGDAPLQERLATAHAPLAELKLEKRRFFGSHSKKEQVPNSLMDRIQRVFADDYARFGHLL